MNLICLFRGHDPQVRFIAWQEPPHQSTRYERETSCVRCGRRLKTEDADRIEWVHYVRRSQGKKEWWNGW